MSDKKRFFYAVYTFGDSDKKRSGVFRVDCTIFNCNALRQKIANHLITDVGKVYIKSWYEC